MKKTLTEKEAELIDAIRNYVKSYPDGHVGLECYILDLLNELMAEAENK